MKMSHGVESEPVGQNLGHPMSNELELIINKTKHDHMEHNVKIFLVHTYLYVKDGSALNFH